ncbi:MAG: uroporphyrinogen decarboxylase family protein [Anaerolineae bacterium]|jgi:uroporphyrinogen decarboxylase|nr:uroporphyrinogen decarboxylase family protein [Anaerolineae bacterium]
MTTSRERVLQALSFQPTDRVPRDLGGMRSTGISAFAYPKLVAALGLPPRPPKVEDTGQMLALPDLDVLEALGCDVVSILDGATNAFKQPDLWKPYDFNGRLPGMVRNPAAFQTQPDGTILQDRRRMPPSSYVFDEEHGGQPLNIAGDLPKPDLEEVKRNLAAREVRDEQIVALRELCRRVRESTDRAIFLNTGALSTPICIHGWGGLAVFPIICITEPDFVVELHELATEHALKNIRALLPEIAPYVDIIMMAADDWGTQNSTIASPKVFRTLFLPYRRRINNEVHRIAPQVKTFLHSCGAIYTLIDLVIESGFDILNPVQWTAGKQGYRAWKEQAKGRITLWGGGVHSQATLPLGSVEDVEREVREVVPVMADGGGYVFCNIHNILAEIAPEKVIAMYRAAE